MDCIDFDAARRERRQKVEPQQFKLGGETFIWRADISLGDLWCDELSEDGMPEAPERFVATSDGGKRMLGYARAIAFRLAPDERERWWSIFDDHDDPVDGDDLIDVLNRLTEHLIGRPTSPSDGSAVGRNDTTTGTTSSGVPEPTSDANSSTPAPELESVGSS